MRRLQGGCQVPIAAFAEIKNNNGNQQLYIRARVVDPCGNPILEKTEYGNVNQADAIGTRCAEQLLAAGADKILATLLPNSEQDSSQG